MFRGLLGACLAIPPFTFDALILQGASRSEHLIQGTLKSRFLRSPDAKIKGDSWGESNWFGAYPETDKQ